ncbi:hypothetical protein [Sphingomonas bacterium]|uniref:hypothetical protein n=1 Tax=Sphingomonas bacterium TaxID=1895847 RepID=UPI001576F642|nr:hypothetical protein [Sphingomonas bacterium]
MRHPLIPATLLALVAPVLLAGEVGIDAPDGGGQIATMTFHERIIVRVPRLGPPPPQVTWKEKRGPKCIAASDLAGALVSGPGVVDLVLVGNRRVRAKLDNSCEPLDFYSGFYLKPAADGQICAARDSIRARSGALCEIDTFKTLKAALPKR